MKRVLIIEAEMKRYRVPFYERLRSALIDHDVDLRVAYSDPSATETSKQDTCELPSSCGIKVRGYWILPGRLMFQPLLKTAMQCDLVVVEQANKFLLNHLLLPLSLTGIKRVAFFGHGINGREDRLWLSEWYRRKTLNWVTWWFAYSASTTRYLVANGVPPSKITTVQNAIDTNELRAQVSAVSEQRKNDLRAQLGVPFSAPLGIYCGILDKVKRIPFLIEAAKVIRDRVPNFHLLLIGGGPEQAPVRSAIEKAPWIHFLGPRFGKEKAELIAISDVMLMPGAVGLVILDAFAAGLPLLSTCLSIHGPEMEYLDDGENGLLSDADPVAFANMAVAVFSDRTLLSRLRAGAWDSGARYTLENMVSNFKAGIESCLGLQSGREVMLAPDGLA